MPKRHGCEERPAEPAGDQLVLAPEDLITFAHFSVSSTMVRPNSTGVAGVGGPPRSINLAIILGSARPALTSRLSLSTISGGVLFGAVSPLQELAS